LTNDAKLGLAVGLGLVIAVAVIYFRSDSARKQEEAPAATAVKPAAGTPQPPPRGQTRATKARPAVQGEETEQAASAAKRHTIAEGDTLASLAEHYYGDREKSQEIYNANRDVLTSPDGLPLGTMLVIPHLPHEAADETSQREP
jgi:nucleoid-associated protein YgaU